MGFHHQRKTHVRRIARTAIFSKARISFGEQRLEQSDLIAFVALVIKLNIARHTDERGLLPMARKKKAVPFEGKETPEEERLEHKALMRGKGKRKAKRGTRR